VFSLQHYLLHLMAMLLYFLINTIFQHSKANHEWLDVKLLVIKM
jgi:hypothetical protein